VPPGELHPAPCMLDACILLALALAFMKQTVPGWQGGSVYTHVCEQGVSIKLA
jgi:hypothetical protein